MTQYNVTINGLSPLLMHQDNIIWSEKVKRWTKDPANKSNSTAGDDRTPSWTWLGYIYHDGRNVGVPSDNLMTMLREGGAKVKVANSSKETYKKHTQAGIIIDAQQWDLLIDGHSVPIDKIAALVNEPEFIRHVEVIEEHGFELLVKRAKVGQSKHVRVRPFFRNWQLTGSLTVLDPERTGLTKGVLQMVLDQAGALCGLGDWRPSSPQSSGRFGRFEAFIQ